TQAAGVKSPDNAPNLFTIADLSQVWVLCDLYENELSRVRVGDAANIRLNAYPDRVFQGRVGNLSPLLDSTTRTVKMRGELDNPGGIMRLGMFATVDLVSQAFQTRIVVPTTALVRLHDAEWVFVKAEHGFRKLRVQTGRAIGPDWQEILEGLDPGQLVVRN